MIGSINIYWCAAPQRAQELSHFFAINVESSYISHSELQGLRALSPSEWRDDLEEILMSEIEPRLTSIIDSPPGLNSQAVAIAERDTKLIGLALITFLQSAPVAYCIIEDIIVDRSYRNNGVGEAMLEWFASEAQSRHITRMFLESGLANERAHAFFEREGFHKISFVMMRQL